MATSLSKATASRARPWRCCEPQQHRLRPSPALSAARGAQGRAGRITSAFRGRPGDPASKFFDGEPRSMMAEPLLLSNARVLDVEAGRYHDGRCSIRRSYNGHGGQRDVALLCGSTRRGILEEMLRRGFTTVRDAGGADFDLANAIEEGLIRGPRLLFCGHSLSPTGGHGDIRGPGQLHFNECLCCAGLSAICDGVAEVRRASREEIRRGANQIKLMVSGGVASPTDRIDSLQFFLGGATGGSRRSTILQYSGHYARLHGPRHQSRAEMRGRTRSSTAICSTRLRWRFSKSTTLFWRRR